MLGKALVPIQMVIGFAVFVLVFVGPPIAAAQGVISGEYLEAAKTLVPWALIVACAWALLGVYR